MIHHSVTFAFYRSEEIEKFPAYNLWYQHGEMIALTPGTNVHMTVVGKKPGESISSGRPLVNHPSTDEPIMATTALKPHEQQGFQEKLSTCNKRGKACTNLQFVQQHAETSFGEKPHKYMPCGKPYSDYTEDSTFE